MSTSPGASTSVFQRIERSGVAHDGIKMLKEMILRGDLVAGQRLPPERDLAEMLGVSRPTLRESIRALIALNILDSRHGHGTYVTSLEPKLLAEPIDFVLQLHRDRMLDLVEARRIIEPALAGLAAERITDAQLDELRRLVAEKFDADTHDREAAIELDLAFHRVVADAAGNTILTTILESVAAISRASRESSWRQFQHAKQIGSKDLQEILTALEARDASGAEQAMRQHIARIADAIEAELKSQT